MRAMGFVDLHNHLLHGLDDGPSDPSESLDLVKNLAQLGYETLCVTPHQRFGLYVPDLAAIDATTRSVQDKIDKLGIKVRLIHGAENCFDELLLERSNENNIPCYRETRAFLLEMPGFHIPSELTQFLYGWRLKGFVPVLAHVERYSETPNLSRRCAELAQYALITVNLGAVGGSDHSWTRIARKLAEDGVVGAFTTDLHMVSDVPSVAKGIRWVKKRLGDQVLRLLLEEHPRKVLEGELPECQMS